MFYVSSFLPKWHIFSLDVMPFTRRLTAISSVIVFPVRDINYCSSFTSAKGRPRWSVKRQRDVIKISLKYEKLNFQVVISNLLFAVN